MCLYSVVLFNSYLLRGVLCGSITARKRAIIIVLAYLARPIVKGCRRVVQEKCILSSGLIHFHTHSNVFRYDLSKQSRPVQNILHVLLFEWVMGSPSGLNNFL